MPPFSRLPPRLVRPAAADSAADFFKGKQINIVVSYGVGTYDLYARLIAQFLKRHLPGQPTVIVQNMPGAGGVKAARYLLEVAPKDGTTLGVLAQTIPFDTMLGFSEGVDARRFHWIGRTAMNVEVGIASGKSGVRSFDDVRAREVSVGGTGGTASSTAMPYLLSRLAGAKFKLISGYRSANEALLAMDRGEIDMVGCIRNRKSRHEIWTEAQGWLDPAGLSERTRPPSGFSGAADHRRTWARRRGQANS